MATEDDVLNSVQDFTKFRNRQNAAGAVNFAASALGAPARATPTKPNAADMANAKIKLLEQLANLQGKQSTERVNATKAVFDNLKAVLDASADMFGSSTAARAQVQKVNNQLLGAAYKEAADRQMAVLDQAIGAGGSGSGGGSDAKGAAIALTKAGAIGGGATETIGFSGESSLHDPQFLTQINNAIATHGDDPKFAGQLMAYISATVPGGADMDAIVDEAEIDEGVKQRLKAATSNSVYYRQLQESAQQAYGTIAQQVTDKLQGDIGTLKGGGGSAREAEGYLDMVGNFAKDLMDPDKLAQTIGAITSPDGMDPNNPEAQRRILAALDALDAPDAPDTVRQARDELFDSEGFQEFMRLNNFDPNDPHTALKAARMRLRERQSAAKQHNTGLLAAYANKATSGAGPLKFGTVSSSDTKVGLNPENGLYSAVTGSKTEELPTSQQKAVEESVADLPQDKQNQKMKDMTDAFTSGADSAATQGRINEIQRQAIAEKPHATGGSPLQVSVRRQQLDAIEELRRKKREGEADLK